MRKAQPFTARIYNGLFKPRRVNILGFELAGIVESVGSNVSRFKIGDEVIGYSGLRFGAYAEYICLPHIGNQNKGLAALKPSSLSFPEAAALPTGALAALNNLRQGNISEGKRVLINGASGSVGTYAVQIASYYGAVVTGVCSTKNMRLVSELGADQVIDYTQEGALSDIGIFDLVFDAVDKLPKKLARKMLAPNGMVRNVSMSRKDSYEDLETITRLAQDGHIKPVIDRFFPFEKIPDGHHYVEQGHKRGNVGITL